MTDVKYGRDNGRRHAMFFIVTIQESCDRNHCIPSGVPKIMSKLKRYVMKIQVPKLPSRRVIPFTRFPNSRDIMALAKRLNFVDTFRHFRYKSKPILFAIECVRNIFIILSKALKMIRRLILFHRTRNKTMPRRA